MSSFIPHKPGDSALPPQFIDYWKGLQENHQREDVGRQCLRVALRRLDDWRATGDEQFAIPGYTRPPEMNSQCCSLRRAVPRGWSYRNLVKIKPRRIMIHLRAD